MIFMLGVYVLALFLAYGAQMARADGETASLVTVVYGGEAEAVIVIAAAADDQTVAAADLLVEYVEKSTGAVLPIRTDAQFAQETALWSGKTKLFVGKEAAADVSLNAELATMDTDGFIVRTAADSIKIAGPNGWGTTNGVLEFLERYVGVLWLFPGPDGEDVPQSDNVAVPEGTIKQEPAFTFRSINPFKNRVEPYGDWGVRNRLQNGLNPAYVKYLHNLHTLFPPEVYGVSHPEFYPNGQPPQPGVIGAWQPCFTVPGTVDAAVYGITEYFRTHPSDKYFSLGVNDGGGYCEEKPSHPDYPNRFNSVGLTDMSDLYYAWVNEVVEQVLLQYPDKWFGLLAYSNVTDPPSFPIHPRVIPFVTKDRMAWVDETARTVGHGQSEVWTQQSGAWGWYDYMYGVWYAVPRVYPHLMADNYRYAHQNGVIAHTAEMSPNLLDGPKAWLSAKLQWDPYQDEDALLDEWYERMVGPAAADDLASFFALWEQFWMERIPDSAWFRSTRNGLNTNLGYDDPSYLNEVTAFDIAESKRLLGEVLAKADTERHKARARLLLQGFEYSEASVASFDKKYDPPTNETAALAMLDQALTQSGTRFQLAERRRELIDDFADEPALKFPKPPLYDWIGGNGSEFWGLVDYMAQYEPAGGTVTSQVYALARGASPSFARDYARLLERAGSEAFNQLANPSFEEGDLNAPPWTILTYLKGEAKRVEGFARSGNASILNEGMERGGVVQWAAVRPGPVASRIFYYTPPGTVTQGTIEVVWKLRNVQNKTVSFASTTLIPLGDTAGQWASAHMFQMIPETVEGAAVKDMQMIVLVRERDEPDLRVYFDDAQFVQFGSSFLTAQTFWKFADRLIQQEPNGGPLHDQVETLAQNGDTEQVRKLAALLLEVADGAPSVAVNGSFETGAQNAPPWLFPSATVGRTTERFRSGGASLKINGAGRKDVYEYVPLQPGVFATRAYVYVPPGAGTNGTIQARMYVRDAQKQTLSILQGPTLKIAAAGAGSWTPIELIDTIPPVVNGVPVEYAALYFYINGLDAGASIYLDDVAVHQTVDD